MFIASLLLSAAICTPIAGEAPSLLPEGRQFKLIWSDEFNGTRLDASKWSYRTNFWGQRASWFAAPEDGAVEVRDGAAHLKIVCRPDGSYCSPQLQTGGLLWDDIKIEPPKGGNALKWPFSGRERAKFEHKYGYWECRFKSQRQAGWWSAFWLQSAQQGSTVDPARSGIESDVMESFEPGRYIVHAFHYNGYGADYRRFNAQRAPYTPTADGAFKVSYPMALDEWHTFGLLWERDGYTVFVDGKQSGHKVGKVGDEAVSHTEQFALITTELKGFRQQHRPDPEVIAAHAAGDEFVVDYVRVYDFAEAQGKSLGASVWISGNSKSPEAAAPVLEKTWVLEAVPKSAKLELAVAGWCEIEVNGQRIDDCVLSPVTCQPDKRNSVIVREVAAFLKPGENRLSVLLGNGWFNCFTKGAWGFENAAWHTCAQTGSPCIKGTLELGDGKVIVTDATWICYDSPIVFNALRNGEWYDARREGQRHNERKAKVEKYPPAGKISPEDAAPCRVFEPLAPVKSFAAANGGKIYDFGSNRAGWCEIEVVGEAGAKIAIDYDEMLDGERLLGNVNVFQQRNKDPRPGQHDEYTLAGRPQGERWHPRFTYHGFRYARVVITGKAELKSIKSWFVHSDVRAVGEMKISDPVFAKLNDATRRSYLSNNVGIPTDCPHREKNGWTGDAQLAVETGLWNYDAKAVYVHFLRMMLDAQRENGAVPCILPCTEYFGFGWGSGPAWDAILFQIPRQLYRFYGEDRYAREAYPAMKKYLEFILTKARADGLIEYGLGDWCYPRDLMKLPPILLTDSAYVYWFLTETAFWADRFGETGYARLCRSQAAAIKAAFNRKFYEGNGVYANGELACLAAPLYFQGLCQDGEEPKVLAALLKTVREQQHRAMFGILGAKWVPRVLSENGYIDDAYRFFVQSEYPGWAKWVADGEDTLWETWNGRETSHNHIMYGDLSAWAYEYLAGIKIRAPGFAQVEIQPHLPQGVDSFDFTFTTPSGKKLRVAAHRDAAGNPIYSSDPKPSNLAF